MIKKKRNEIDQYLKNSVVKLKKKVRKGRHLDIIGKRDNIFILIHSRPYLVGYVLSALN